MYRCHPNRKDRPRLAIMVIILSVPWIVLTGCDMQPGDAGRTARDAAAGVTARAAIVVPEHIKMAVASAARPEADLGRDPDRRPGEVLAFFGIEPGMQVADIMAGDGYYSEILSRAVGARGSVYAQNTERVLKAFYEEPLSERLSRPGLDNITRLDSDLEDPGLPANLDAALLIRFYHDFYWMKTDRAAFNRAIFAALKPGGVFGVVDHHAATGTGDAHVEDLHRVDADLVRKEILAAGFVLDAESDVLANPEDSRDWFVYEDDGARRDQTDRFVYRFRKPA